MSSWSARGVADAALFCAVHDVLQSPAALRTIVEHLRPGAAVAAAGGKRPGPWMCPLRPWVTHLHTPYIADLTGFDTPWRHLAEVVPDLSVREPAFGACYLAVGHTPVVENRRIAEEPGGGPGPIRAFSTCADGVECLSDRTRP